MNSWISDKQAELREAVSIAEEERNAAISNHAKFLETNRELFELPVTSVFVVDIQDKLSCKLSELVMEVERKERELDFIYEAFYITVEGASMK